MNPKTSDKQEPADNIAKKSIVDSGRDELGPRCPYCNGISWRVYRIIKRSDHWERRRKCKNEQCNYEYTSRESGPPEQVATA